MNASPAIDASPWAPERPTRNLDVTLFSFQLRAQRSAYQHAVNTSRSHVQALGVGFTQQVTYTSACWPNLSARASMQTFQDRSGRTVGDECKADGTECVRNSVEPSLNALKRLAQARSGGRAARRDLLTSQPAGPDLWEILYSLSFHVYLLPFLCAFITSSAIRLGRVRSSVLVMLAVFVAANNALCHVPACPQSGRQTS